MVFSLTKMGQEMDYEALKLPIKACKTSPTTNIYSIGDLLQVFSGAFVVTILYTLATMGTGLRS